MALGLKSGTVRLSIVTSEAEDTFKRVHRMLRSSLPVAWKIEHIGSTAVPGMLAKPIVDIAIGMVDAADVRSGIELLQQAGYRYRGWREDAGGHVFDDFTDTVTTQHIHLVEGASQQWREYLAFRDYLRTSSDARATYEEAKRALATSFPTDRRAYTIGKRTVIDRLVAQALQSRGR